MMYIAAMINNPPLRVKMKLLFNIPEIPAAMKRYPIITATRILSIALFLVCLLETVEAKNLLVNGSFETNTNGAGISSGLNFVDVTTYAGWRFFKEVPTTVTNFSATIISNASAGSHAMRLDVGKTAGGSGAYGLDRANALLPVTVGTYYLFSFDAAWIAGATAGNLGFYISEYNAAGVFTGSQTVFPNFTVSSASYQTFTAGWTSQNSNTTQINITFAPLLGIAGATALSIDNVQMGIMPPAITLTLPANGSSYTAPASIGLAASVTANGHSITQVQFYNGATLLGSAATAPYTLTVNNVPAGSYTVSAQAVYDSGSTVSSATSAVTVTNLPPVVTLIAPANGSSYTAPASIGLAASVTANGHSITQVQFYNGATLLGSAASAPYTLTANNVTAGSYTVSAQAVYDSGSTVSSATSAVTVTNVFPETATPAIINTVYGTEDVVVADYVATNLRYGADPTGVIDSTVAIQNALNDCYNSGGGTVYLPTGTYIVTNTLTVPSFVTLRGDWQDPDSVSSPYAYGTVVRANLASGDNGPVLFQIGGSAGVMGLTTYYPNQNASAPVAYNYTFSCLCDIWSSIPGTYMSSSIINCTMLNSYRGIGISALDITRAHELSTVKNVKGTALYRGAVAYNSADVSTWENITFNNSYWANAGAAYNAPSLATLNTWTRANGIAFTFGDLEWDQFYALSCSDYLYGINIVAGSRISFCGVFLWANIQNTTIAVKVDAIDTRWGMSFLRSVLNGSTYSIQNNTAGYVHVCDSTVNGNTGGSGSSQIAVTTPGTSPTSYTQTTCPKVTRAVLYNVIQAPYNAPYSVPQTGLPAADATAAIQAALNDAGNAGGGVVYLPAGWYRLNTHLSVPANVELRGSSSVPERDQFDCSLGTVLLGYEGAGTANPNTDPALVTLNGSNAGIRGIRFFYPNNNPAGGTVTTYPYCIRGNGANQYVVNIALTGVYNGVDFAANRCDNHVIRKVRGVAYLHFICVGSSTQGWVEGCHSNGNAVDRCNFGIPGWIVEANILTAVINPITRPNEILLLINGASSENVLNMGAYGVNIGVNTANCDVNVFNLGTDNLGTGGYSGGGFNTNIKLLNVMKWNGPYSSLSGTGTITLYNPMTL